jgi:hypothetical protein
VAYLDSLPLGELADLLGALPEPTRVALMYELSQRGPAWARLPEEWPQLPTRRRSLREWSPSGAPPAGHPHPSSCAAGRPRPSRWSTSLSTSGVPARWPSGGWPRRCGPGRPAATRPSVSSARTGRTGDRQGRASGRGRTTSDGVRTADRARDRSGPRPCAGACCLAGHQWIATARWWDERFVTFARYSGGRPERASPVTIRSCRGGFSPRPGCCRGRPEPGGAARARCREVKRDGTAGLVGCMDQAPPKAQGYCVTRR